MSFTDTAPFRFRSLPSEIRNKIYRILLCEFAPPVSDEQHVTGFTELERANRARHTIETAILRTNKETYREAYHVMVKTNRFIRIQSVRGLPLITLTKPMCLAIVSDKRHLVEQFKGFVLSVNLSTTPRFQLREGPEYNACSLMILHRDLDRLCKGIKDGDLHASGYSQNLRLSIIMAPVIYSLQRIQYAPKFEDFFSTKTQEALLKPFRNLLRGYKEVKIIGHVDESLAHDVRTDMARDQCSDPQAVINEARMAKEWGSRLYQAGMCEDACEVWLDGAAAIEQIHESSSWPSLVRSGDANFVPTVAELSFLMRLNIIHHQIADMESPGSKFLPITGFIAGQLAHHALSMVHQSLERDYWKRGYKYTPSPQHMAKLLYRNAVFLRLTAKPGTADEALVLIRRASQIQPTDTAIRKEKLKILAWVRQAR